ncbi:MAG TPA: hypothetical protein VG845_08965 [Dehalococcoidia bacterium]|nr:hypothetical protein [Dehalococcoidia bacterium]
MAHNPSFDSRPSPRPRNERRWLVVLTAVALFAYYVASGSYAFTHKNAPSTAPEAASHPALVAEIGSMRIEQGDPVQTSKAAIADVFPMAETDLLIAETSSARVTIEEPQQQPAPVAEVSAPAVSQSANLPQVAQAAPVTTQPPPAVQPVASSAPAAAPAAPPSIAEYWRGNGILIETQGQEWDAQSLANVDAALSALPASVRSQLGNPALGQLHILVNSYGRSLSGKQPYGGPANYFSTGEGRNELVMFPKQRVSTILHELGHAYNLRRTPAGHYAKVLIDPEMESFMAATGWQVMASREQIAQSVDHMKLTYQYTGAFRWPEVSKFDPLEDFANSFAIYFADPAGLRAQSPERYAWMAANLPK